MTDYRKKLRKYHMPQNDGTLLRTRQRANEIKRRMKVCREAARAAYRDAEYFENKYDAFDDMLSKEEQWLKSNT